MTFGPDIVQGSDELFYQREESERLARARTTTNPLTVKTVS